jgi:hypothetical protein
MTDKWRYACARCGSRSVRRGEGGWVCGHYRHWTPVLWDLKREEWVEASRDDKGAVPRSTTEP